MTLLTALITLFTAISSFQPLDGFESRITDDPVLQQIGNEQSQANPADMARGGVGGGHCPRG